jgi:Zn finger protein HypA/HybF involved in hydrogenase expression
MFKGYAKMDKKKSSVKKYRCRKCPQIITRDNIADYFDYPECEKCQEKATRLNDGKHSKLL